ncbi:hypothetical protein I4U23_010788 [Adineta vaga]|nr:hypothetical protein I4U23_010788 [Adineta vaga]
MTDKEPLLKTSLELATGSDVGNHSNENGKQVLSSSLFDWRHCFNSRQDSPKYDQLDNNTEADDDDTNFLMRLIKLFGFGNGFDYLLMFFGGCFVIGHVFCIIASFVLFGELTGTFATQSFIVNCQSRQDKLINSFSNHSTCPHGIDMIQSNYEQFHKFCHQNDTMFTTTKTVVSILPSIRETVMHKIYLLLIVGFISWVCCSLEIIAWTTAIKRQTSRMNISLFRSLIQRNMTYLDTNSTSELTSKLSDNISKIELGINIDFLICTAIVLTVIVSIVVSFVINWKLSLILSCLSPMVAGASMIFSRVIANETDNELTTYARAGKIVQEVFSSLRTVHSFNGGQFEQKSLKEMLPQSLRD